MRQENNLEIEPAMRPSPVFCRRIAPSCCRSERERRSRRFRRANRLWLKRVTAAGQLPWAAAS